MRWQLSFCRLLLTAGLIAASSPAAAWNAAGHRLTAVIAWRLMGPLSRDEIRSILACHPDHADWLKRSDAPEPGYGAFLEASTWPDDIRRDKRFHDADEAETPLLPGFAEMGRHRNWHYMDLPLGQPAKDRHSNGELDTRLAEVVQVVGSTDRSCPQRAIALSWLIHLVGDVHQPLHVVSRYDEDGHGDEGGNARAIDDPFSPLRRNTSLHRYWDDLPGPPWLRGQRLEAAGDSLMAQGGSPPHSGAIQIWINESRILAETVVYANLDGEVPTLSAQYHDRALQTARERVALAGKRLALLLEQLLRPASVPRETPRR